MKLAVKRVAPVAGALVVALAALTAAPDAGALDARPLQEAREAAARLSFSGRLIVTWTDHNGPHSRTMEVAADDGVLRVDGRNVLVARSGDRFAFHEGRGWDLLWPSALVGSKRPSAGDKYALVTSSGPPVAGRPTVLTELLTGGEVRERLYLDETSRLLLRREQLVGGDVVRSVTFDSLTARVPAEPPIAPTALVKDAKSRPLRSTNLPKPYVAPDELPDGYRRVGAYRTDDTVHLLYSDGVYDLSVFEQHGRLRPLDGTAGRKVRVGDRRGTHMTWPGGEVVVWQGGDTVFTVVGDGPPAEVLAAARSMSRGAKLSVFDRIRRAVRSFVDPG